MSELTGRPVSIPVAAVWTGHPGQRLAPPWLWFPAAAMAVALLIAAVGGLTFGVLAALEAGVAGDRWLATVQAHGELQLWGWFAVFIAALLFEFIVRFNGRPPIPVVPRALVLSCLGGGAIVSATGRVLFYEGGQVLVIAGATSMVLGALLLTGVVLRIRPTRPLRMDLHPLFFRSGAIWLLVAAIAALVASRDVVAGATQFGESQVVAELFLRGFVVNVTVAVALRAFVGHLGLPPLPVARQRVIWALVNGSILAWVLGRPSFGLPGVEALVSVGDLFFAAGVLWATWALGIGRAVGQWSRHSARPQILVPIAWLGLVVYAIVLSVQAVGVLAGGAQPAPFEVGAARHVLMLGFVAPLFIAMAHVVLERFLIGRLVSEHWLTASSALLIIAWPMRVVPSLVGGGEWDATRGLMATAGILSAAALLIAAAVALQNAIVAERYARQARGHQETRPALGIAMSMGLHRGGEQRRNQMRELDVREEIAAGGEPFPRIMSAVKELGPGEGLLLIAPFEPVPLYSVLGEQGFQHEAEAHPDGSWHVTFRRRSG